VMSSMHMRLMLKNSELMVKSRRRASSSGVPNVAEMEGMRLCSTEREQSEAFELPSTGLPVYVSVLKLTKSNSCPRIVTFAVSRCFDCSGLALSQQ
jgi:hypothetical protein